MLFFAEKRRATSINPDVARHCGVIIGGETPPCEVWFRRKILYSFCGSDADFSFWRLLLDKISDRNNTCSPDSTNHPLMPSP